MTQQCHFDTTVPCSTIFRPPWLYSYTSLSPSVHQGVTHHLHGPFDDKGWQVDDRLKGQFPKVRENHRDAVGKQSFEKSQGPSRFS